MTAARPVAATLEAVRLMCVCGGGICGDAGDEYVELPDWLDDLGWYPARRPTMGPLLYRCPGCRRLVPWCLGAADDKPELCDDCWAEAVDLATAPSIRSGASGVDQ